MTQDEVKASFDYDPIKGVLINKAQRAKRIKIGSEAGRLRLDGYRDVKVKNKYYLTHRLIWVFVTGSWPKNYIDHINQIKNDNRFCNLRDVTRSQNKQNTCLQINNSSGVKGVAWCKVNNQWLVRITLNKKIYYLGLFKNINAAALARKQAEEQLHSHRRLDA